jgi:GST-like protein
MIELYSYHSPNVLKVLMMLEEVGLEHRLHHLEMVGAEAPPELKGLTLNGKVPVIVDSDGPGGTPFTLWESGAILIYLAEKTGRFLPVEPRERHTVIQWLMFQMGGVGPMFGQSNHFRIVAPPGQDYGRIRYRTQARRLFEVMEARLGEAPYFGGEAYSIADIAILPWAREFHLAGNGVAFEEVPNLTRWMDEICARPAIARAQAFWADYWASGMANMGQANPDHMDRFLGRGKWAAP